MLHWVGATIICFQRMEAEVLRDRCIWNFLNEGRAAKGGLATLVFYPDDLVDVVYSLVHQVQLFIARTPRFSGGEVSPGSLNRGQYRPEVREGGFTSLNKGSEGGGCGATPEAYCVTEGTSSPRLSGAERYCDIRPSF
ncbi:hypothetical protein B296_00012628 [Ensete ventricosum]|uniref:Uncharacterized protein n=1 Tax=Ensete ventricosum TaxID=4639 RepID=A0A426ZF54_ENSVE|nr:hypothetical protein B296_00012628 [Ensete ventricosum]